MTNNKNRILYILKCLWEHTDDDHSSTITDILDYLESLDVHVNRRTIPADIAELQDFGFDIICERSTQNRYYFGERIFELPELQLLVDAVQSAKFIPMKKSKVLIGKLTGMASTHQADKLKRHLLVDKKVKATNEALYYTVDALNDSINAKRKIEFQYYEYTPKKKKTLKHDGQIYSFSPYDMVWHNDNYYVFGFSDNHDKVIKFRVDRICKPEVTDHPAVRKPKGFDAATFCKQVFNMYDCDTCMVELKCQNHLMKTMIDRFGESVKVISTGDEYFIIRVEVAPSKTFYGWMFGFAGEAEIISPEEVKQSYIAQAKKICE